MSQLRSIPYVEVILKLTERCNINCDYCYVFNRGNFDINNSPAMSSLENMVQLAKLLKEGCTEYNIKILQIDFHGGEPLMYKKTHFSKICELFHNIVCEKTELRLTLQTNGMLVDEEWISLFEKYRISVSISLDGPKHINDLHRLDKKYRSSYDSAVNGLRLLQKASKERRLIADPGILCVILPEANGNEVYRHFVDDLNVSAMDFLLSDDNYECSSLSGKQVGDFLISALDEWIADDDPNIFVRIFNFQMEALVGTKAAFLGFNPTAKDAFSFTVGSDGYARVNDTLRSTAHPVFDRIGHVSSCTLREIIESPQSQLLNQIAKQLPSDCSDCVWRNICAGGQIANRYSQLNEFEKKTIHCDAIRRFSSRCAGHLLRSGVPAETLAHALDSYNILS